MSALPFDDDLFWAKVNFTDTCWLWTGATDDCGYGYVMRAAYKKGPARSHRYAYAMSHGNIEEGQVVMHSCDTPACVNPSHLSVGTVEDNVADMARKDRHGKITLSRAQVNEIVSRFSAGELGKDLAEEFGVAKSTISRYVHGVRRVW